MELLEVHTRLSSRFALLDENYTRWLLVDVVLLSVACSTQASVFCLLLLPSPGNVCRFRCEGLIEMGKLSHDVTQL